LEFFEIPAGSLDLALDELQFALRSNSLDNSFLYRGLVDGD
jgi:hypothetical protein